MKKLTVILVLLLSLCSIYVTGCKKKEDNTLRISEVTHSLFYAPLYHYL